MTHTLKTWPAYYKRVAEGSKTFEVRRNDRGFQAGDVLHLKEWCPETQAYTGSEMKIDVTYVLPGGDFGIEPGYCVMGIKL